MVDDFSSLEIYFFFSWKTLLPTSSGRHGWSTNTLDWWKGWMQAGFEHTNENSCWPYTRKSIKIQYYPKSLSAVKRNSRQKNYYRLKRLKNNHKMAIVIRIVRIQLYLVSKHSIIVFVAHSIFKCISFSRLYRVELKIISYFNSTHLW